MNYLLFTMSLEVSECMMLFPKGSVWYSIWYRFHKSQKSLGPLASLITFDGCFHNHKHNPLNHFHSLKMLVFKVTHKFGLGSDFTAVHGIAKSQI